jgi:hypothetical protein
VPVLFSVEPSELAAAAAWLTDRAALWRSRLATLKHDAESGV